MGITFLAAGTSVPEAVSSVIVSKQGMSFCYIIKPTKQSYSIVKLKSVFFNLSNMNCRKPKKPLKNNFSIRFARNR